MVSRVLVVAWLALVTVACGPPGSDVQRDAHNSRDTGPWLSLGRSRSADGALVVHVTASYPEHAETIAQKIVRQNFPTSARPIRVVIDPTDAQGQRRVFRWDGVSLTPDTAPEGLPPRASSRAAGAGSDGH
ncbi:hypothetical protein TBR22_A28790 [Luteitalea sp. TBR-22]|uniref:hypothetical protein n=1 Tax=Luteitalea sp. TBR-22 TaxID=2802971 RepID=UPI001AF78303|nr:hypothetical protein [Luteitalea sp. TBR-22]BCS33652.1 hypothetical protein TBR22_A28790 [Luteitalea sp. TBR-22]